MNDPFKEVGVNHQGEQTTSIDHKTDNLPMTTSLSEKSLVIATDHVRHNGPIQRQEIPGQVISAVPVALDVKNGRWSPSLVN